MNIYQRLEAKSHASVLLGSRITDNMPNSNSIQCATFFYRTSKNFFLLPSINSHLISINMQMELLWYLLVTYNKAGHCLKTIFFISKYLNTFHKSLYSSYMLTPSSLNIQHVGLFCFCVCVCFGLVYLYIFLNWKIFSITVNIPYYILSV